MSDNNIPLEIQMEIIQRIPDIKSVIRCRSVSKAWKSMIDSKEFVTAHTLRHPAKPHLLIRKRDCNDGQVKYVSIVDDDTFPNQKVSVFVPDSVNKFSPDSKIVGSSHGLFCVYDDKMSNVVIWNPSLRKTVDIAVPNVSREKSYRTIVGFGVCPGNLDPKLVKIRYVSDWSKLKDVNTSTQVEVFTLSSSGGIWRSPLSGNVPHKSIGFGSRQTVVDGFIYWVGFDRINMNDSSRNPNLIMSFNLATEEFTKVNLPKHLAHYPYVEMSVFNLREYLAVVMFDMYNQREICHLWMMIGRDCTKSFNRLYSVNTPDSSISTTLGFRKNGAPIIELANGRDDFFKYQNKLFIYDPVSGNITHIGIKGLQGKFFVHFYKETLLLLGQ